MRWLAAARLYDDDCGSECVVCSPPVAGRARKTGIYTYDGRDIPRSEPPDNTKNYPPRHALMKAIFEELGTTRPTGLLNLRQK